MAGFGRSNSLSINTSGTLFGNNTSNANQGQQSAGLFGAKPANASSSQPGTAGGLFSSTSQPQTGGLFGAAAPASQPTQSSSLFGATTSQPQSSGLFGGLNKPATPAATGTSLFGGSTAASQPQQGSSLFGGALGGNTQAQNQTTSQSGGLFGQQNKPSLFGSSTQQPTTTPSLFGNTTQQQNKPSLFGATQQTQPQQNTMFGATQNTGAQPAQGAIQIKTADNIKGTTRFHELHPDFQSEIQKLDDIFQGHMSNAQRIRESLPRQGELVATLPPDVTYIEQFMSTVELGIDNDSGNIARLKEFIEKDIEEARLCYRAVTNQSLPAQFRYGNAANLSASTISQPTTSADDDDPTKPVDLVPYFSKRADSLSDTLELYQRHIREIEAHLRTMEAGTIERAQQLAGQRSGMRDQRRELAEALNAIEAAIMEAAVKVGKTRDMVTQQTMGRAGAGVL